MPRVRQNRRKQKSELRKKRLVGKKYLVFGKRVLTKKGKRTFYRKMVARIAPAIVDSIFYGLAGKEKKKIAETLVKKARVSSHQEEMSMKERGSLGKKRGGIYDEPEIVFARWGHKGFGEIAHEIAHFIGDEYKKKHRIRNPYILANAYTEYFKVLFGQKRRYVWPTEDKSMDRLTERGEFKSIEEQGIPFWDANINELILFEALGQWLGEKALELETQTGKPGAGLFFINEVCSGKNWREVKKELIEGTTPGFKEWRQKYGKTWKKVPARK